MGYDTSFTGNFTLDRPLEEIHRKYLQAFSETRRMKRDTLKVILLPDPLRKAVGYPVGIDGEFFVGGLGDFGQEHDHSVTNNNSPPASQPGLWCQWTPSEDGSAIQWDGGEKFYNYIEWLQYLIENFISRWGYKLNGEVCWNGEDDVDSGILSVKDNVLTVTNTGNSTYWDIDFLPQTN